MGEQERDAFARMSAVEVVAAYADAADAHGRATEDGDADAANAAHDAIAAAWRELRGRGEEATGELLVLLEHPNPAVRKWAAAHALTFAPEQAEPVLEHLAGGAGIVAFNAGMTLQVWRSGELRFP